MYELDVTQPAVLSCRFTPSLGQTETPYGYLSVFLS
jgi:hypothetical protein